jgi:hypothetical protein
MDAEKLIKNIEDHSKRIPLNELNNIIKDFESEIERREMKDILTEFISLLNKTFPNDRENIEKIIFVKMLMSNNTIIRIEIIKNNKKIIEALNKILNILKEKPINQMIDNLNKEYKNDPTNEKKINRVYDLRKNIESMPNSMKKTVTKEIYNNIIDKLKNSAASPPVSTIVPKSMTVEQYETHATRILNKIYPNDDHSKINHIQENSIEMIESAPGMNDIESKKRYNKALNNISEKLKSQIVDSKIKYVNTKYKDDPTSLKKIKDLMNVKQIKDSMNVKESFMDYTNIEGFDTNSVIDETTYRAVDVLLSTSTTDDGTDNYSNYVNTINKALEFQKVLDSSLNNLFSYLKTQNVNPDVLYEKVNYRDIEHQKIFNINKALDILFYSFYFSFLLIMICMGNIKREHFLIYLFVGLIPVIYPFLFKFGKILIDYLSPPLNGPKNAFVDSHNTIYAYNI